MHIGEDVSGLAMRRGGDRVEQCLCISGLALDRCARAANRKIVAAKPFGGTHARRDIVGVEAALHAHFMVGGREHAAVHVEHAFLDFSAGIVVAPSVAHKRTSAITVALREQCAREHVTALGSGGLLFGKERPHRAVVDAVVP